MRPLFKDIARADEPDLMDMLHESVSWTTKNGRSASRSTNCDRPDEDLKTQQIALLYVAFALKVSLQSSTMHRLPKWAPLLPKAFPGALAVGKFSSQPTNPINNLWQDPIYGYFETHGRMEFKPGEEYGLSDEQKKAVMERYRRKALLKRQFLEMEYNPMRYRQVQGVIVDPSMFRWYAMEMLNAERFYYTPKTVFYTIGVFFLFGYIIFRWGRSQLGEYDDLCRQGKFLWWDRNTRMPTTGGAGNVMFSNG
uniref:NADH dehydrogenase [ubiquinone] 1 beta subcomplex subunit 4 n=1 Tax=Trichuris muris TaxID=70415 RepID=A0A5S6QD09_TRIMR